MRRPSRLVLETQRHLKWRSLDHLEAVTMALCMVWFGYINFRHGFGSFRMPSMTPIASLYAAIPISGVLIALFTVEQLVNGWRHGFESAEPAHEEIHIL